MPYKFFINVVDFHLKTKKNPVREIVECALPSDSSQMAYKLPSDSCQITFMLHDVTPQTLVTTEHYLVLAVNITQSLKRRSFYYNIVKVMPPRIPRLIKTDIIRLWLEGESRTMIVNKCSVGAGTISNLISCKKGVSQFKLWFWSGQGNRFGSQNGRLNIDGLVSLQRFHGILNKRGLKAEQVELLTDELDSHFFKKKGVTTEEYVNTILSLSEISTNLGIPPVKLLDSVREDTRKTDTSWRD